MNNYFSRLYDTLTGKKVPSTVSIDSEISYADINGLLFGDGRGGSGKIPITVYNPGKLITNKGYAVIDNMRRDAQVKVALNFKKHAVLSTGWGVDAPEGQPEDWDVAEFVKEELRNLPGTLDRRLRNILSAVDYGFSVTERIWTRRSDGMIGYKNLKTRKPHDIAFDCDAHGNIVALRQQERPLPPERFIVYSFADEFENPYGISELEAAYVPWWLKDNAYKFLAIMLERLGIPPVFASYNAKAFTRASDQTALQKIIDKMQSGMAATIPRGDSKDDITFWAPEIAGQASTVFIPALQHADMDIAKAILLPGLIGGTSDQDQGSLARSQTHFDVFMLITEALRKEVTETIVQEQIIKPLVDLNFSVDEYPLFRFNPLESKDKQRLMEVWGKLVEQTIVTKQVEDETFIREQLEFPPMMEEAIAKTGELLDDTENFAQSVALNAQAMSRKPNSYEKHVNFVQVASTLDALQGQAVDRLKTAYVDVHTSLLSFVRKNYGDGPAVVGRVELHKLGTVRGVFGEMLRAAYDAGNNAVRQELPRYFAARPISGFAPKEALDYLKQKEISSAVTSNDRLLSAVRTSLLNALRGQKTLGEAVDDLNTVFAPYISAAPAYAETVARTNIIDAYNQGRLVAIRDPDVAGFVAGVEYSAILDDRTTELCSGLDGRVFKAGDPDLDRLTPPNHFNCRSILIPVMIDEPPSEFISAQDKGRALDLAKGFS